MAESITLQSWLEDLNALLEDPTLDEEAMHIILDLARDAAHTVVRPASPLTLFTVGVLVGRGASLEGAGAQISELLRDKAEDEEPVDEADAPA